MVQRKIPQLFDITRTGFSKDDAKRAFERDGAIRLTNFYLNTIDTDGNIEPSSCSFSDIASLLPTLVWDSSEGELLLQHHRADAVHVEHEAMKLQGQALPPHSDGYMWGDCFPDLVILACETPSSKGGGANYLIDGYAVMDRLKPAIKKLLEEELVDHTERASGENNNSLVHGVESIVPVLRYLEPKGWRRKLLTSNTTKDPLNHTTKNNGTQTNLCWRRMVTKDTNASSKTNTNTVDDDDDAPVQVRFTSSLWAPVKVPGTASSNKSKEIQVQAALRELDQAIAAEQDVAPRFVLQAGEALIVDNFRMLHAREAFQVRESESSTCNKRRMWRIWSWTNASFGLPPEIKASGENVPSNVLQAKHSIQAKA